MKLLQRLIENLHPTDVPLSAELARLLMTHCSTMVAAYGQTRRFLYRGMKGQEPAVKGQIRADRRPVDMKLERHELISDAMEELGFPSRRNSLFCTTDLSTASEWGKPYVLFVEDGWEATIFTSQVKGYNFFRLNGEAMLVLGNHDDPAEQRKAMIEFLRKAGITKLTTSTALAKVIRQGYEDVLIRGPGFYAIDRGALTVLRVLEPRLLAGVKLESTGPSFSRLSPKHYLVPELKKIAQEIVRELKHQPESLTLRPSFNGEEPFRAYVLEVLTHRGVVDKLKADPLTIDMAVDCVIDHVELIAMKKA